MSSALNILWFGNSLSDGFNCNTAASDLHYITRIASTPCGFISSSKSFGNTIGDIRVSVRNGYNSVLINLYAFQFLPCLSLSTEHLKQCQYLVVLLFCVLVLCTSTSKTFEGWFVIKLREFYSLENDTCLLLFLQALRAPFLSTKRNCITSFKWQLKHVKRRSNMITGGRNILEIWISE